MPQPGCDTIVLGGRLSGIVMSRPVRTCETPGCEGKHEARGMCAKHYNRWRARHGKRKCETPGCGKPHVARGLCHGCYSWWQNHGERPTSTDRRTKPPERFCETPGCDKPYLARGMCSACYGWWKYNGKGKKPTTTVRPGLVRGVCETPGCDKEHAARGMCHLCYSWWKRHGEKPESAGLRSQGRVRGVCETPGCDKEHAARGMCHACWHWWKANGKKPESADRRLCKSAKPKTAVRPRPKKEFCEIEDCDRPHAARGMCSRCYGWWKRHGEKPTTGNLPDLRLGENRPTRLCEIPDCDRKHAARGMCHICYGWWHRHGETPTTAVPERPPKKEFCEIEDCNEPPIARGMCSRCYSWWQRTGEKPPAVRPRANPIPGGALPTTAGRHLGENEGAQVAHKTVYADLDLSAEDAEQVWILGRHQSQMYNFGVEVALHAIDLGVPIPTNYTANAEVLTPGRWIGTLPTSPTMTLQRVGLRRGLKTGRQHRRQIGKYRAHLEYLSEDIRKAKIKGDSKELEKLERWQARTEHKLEKLLAKGTKRFFRRRKDTERGRMPALGFDEGVQVSETHMKLPGGLLLKFREPFRIPEGWGLTPAAQIIDKTPKFTKRTEPQDRRFRAGIILKKEAPTPQPPETKDDLLGIDLGITIPVCTSTGKQIYMDDDEQEKKSYAHIKYLNRRISKCKPGSRRHKKLSHQKKKAHRKRANRRKNASRHAAKELVDHAQKQGCVMIVAEDLNHKGMRASGVGSVEHPGVNVAQKRGLNRQLWRAALGRLQTDIERRCLLKGIGYIKVPPQGTSQQCHACGTTGGRENQAIFLCSHCGWFGNADHNAAINIRARGWAAVRDTVDRRGSVTEQTNGPIAAGRAHFQLTLNFGI